MILAKPRLMRWNGNAITDHGRQGLSVDIERIEKTHRLANGLMRKYIIADKRTFSTSWENLPHHSNFTVDHFWGFNEMQAFYLANPGGISLELSFGNGSVDTYVVMIQKFEGELQKRGNYDMYSLSVTLEEV